MPGGGSPVTAEFEGRSRGDYESGATVKAQHTFGLNLSWLRVTTVFVVDLGILRLAGHWPAELGGPARAWWPGVGLAAVVALAALITHRRVPLTAILLARALDRFANPAAFLTEGATPGFDHRRRYGRHAVGMREHRRRLVTVIAVEPPWPETSGRHGRGPATAPVSTLPAAVVAAALRQFDVRLDGIDIVSVRTRDDADGTDADDAADTQGPDGWDTWLILRMDPMRNVDAVVVRDSVAATLAAATERLADELTQRHIDARVLPAEEFADVDAAVLAGLQPTRIRRRRRRLKQKRRKGSKQFAATFWVSPRDITSANLERLWSPETDSTAVTVRLTARHRHPQVSVLVRYHSSSRLRRKTHAGLNRLNGRQLSALRTSLPTPIRRTLAVPTRQIDDQESLQIPLGPTAQQSPTRVRVPA